MPLGRKYYVIDTNEVLIETRLKYLYDNSSVADVTLLLSKSIMALLKGQSDCLSVTAACLQHNTLVTVHIGSYVPSLFFPWQQEGSFHY